MAGRKHHFIPQCFLVAFRSDRSGATPHIWLYRRGQAVCEPSILDVAAQRDFYEKASHPELGALDRLMTDYERLLAIRLQSIREMPSGGRVDARLAAEIVTHLTVRTAHLRYTFEGGVRKLIGELGAHVGDPAHVRRWLQIDQHAPDSPLHEEIDKLLKTAPGVLKLGLPDSVLTRILRFHVRENFEASYAETLPVLGNLIDRFSESTISGIRVGHNKVLLSELAPSPRVVRLNGFSWRLVDGPPGGLILPDCVAIALVADGTLLPLTGADLSEVVKVYLPISPDVLLLGEVGHEEQCEVDDINSALATASHQFFVSARTGADLDGLAICIGGRASTAIDDAVAEAISSLERNDGADLAFGAPDEPATLDEIDPAAAAFEEETAMPSRHVPVRVVGWGDDAIAECLAGLVGRVLDAASPGIPTDRIAGVTFAADCSLARQQIIAENSAGDGPVCDEVAYPFDDASVTLVDQAPVLNGHIVFSAGLAEEWMSEDMQRARRAVAILLRLVGEIARIQLLDEAVPGALLSSICHELGGELSPFIDRIWSAYCGTRVSAFVDPSLTEKYEELLTGAVARARNNVAEAHAKYRQDFDTPKLFQAVLYQAGFVLQHSAELLGHRDGLREDLTEERSEVGPLADLGLTRWCDLFATDLRRLWDRRGHWTSIAEFSVLGDHVDRILCGFGIVLEKLGDGTLYAHVRTTAATP